MPTLQKFNNIFCAIQKLLLSLQIQKHGCYDRQENETVQIVCMGVADTDSRRIHQCRY